MFVALKCNGVNLKTAVLSFGNSCDVFMVRFYTYFFFSFFFLGRVNDGGKSPLFFVLSEDWFECCVTRPVSLAIQIGSFKNEGNRLTCTRAAEAQTMRCLWVDRSNGSSS